MRGYIGELGIKRHLREKHVKIYKKSLPYKKGMDVDLVCIQNGEEKDVEIKTSLISGGKQYKTTKQQINDFIRKRDIKLIRRNNETIEQLKSDTHVQLLFTDYIKERETFLKKLNFTYHISKPNKKDIDSIYKLIKADIYKTNTFFIGWIDRNSLINHINSLENKTWSFKGSKRVFWNCNLQYIAKKPNKLSDYLNNIPTTTQSCEKHVSRFYRKQKI